MNNITQDYNSSTSISVQVMNGVFFDADLKDSNHTGGESLTITSVIDSTYSGFISIGNSTHTGIVANNENKTITVGISSKTALRSYMIAHPAETFPLSCPITVTASDVAGQAANTGFDFIITNAASSGSIGIYDDANLTTTPSEPLGNGDTAYIGVKVSDNDAVDGDSVKNNLQVEVSSTYGNFIDAPATSLYTLGAVTVKTITAGSEYHYCIPITITETSPITRNIRCKYYDHGGALSTFTGTLLAGDGLAPITTISTSVGVGAYNTTGTSMPENAEKADGTYDNIPYKLYFKVEPMLDDGIPIDAEFKIKISQNSSYELSPDAFNATTMVLFDSNGDQINNGYPTPFVFNYEYNVPVAELYDHSDQGKWSYFEITPREDWNGDCSLTITVTGITTGSVGNATHELNISNTNSKPKVL